MVVCILTEQVNFKNSQLQAEKKRHQRLKGKVALLLKQMEEKEKLCQDTANLLVSALLTMVHYNLLRLLNAIEICPVLESFMCIKIYLVFRKT